MSETSPLQSESIFVPSGDRHQLHLKRFHTDSNGIPVLCVHGSVENGRIFYSKDGRKGFAPFLALEGYDVFVVDLRGRGKSTPKIGPGNKWGLEETLWEDMPAILNAVVEIKGDRPMHWVSHSWAGVLFLAFLARRKSPAPVASMVFFGTKRHISVWSLKKWFMIDVMWRWYANKKKKKEGFLNAVRYKLGSDNETNRSHEETDVWVREKQWIDWQDGFNYGEALKKTDLPPILYIAAKKDKVLGHPTDVKRLMKEADNKQGEFMFLSRANGNRNDYDHINMLTHKDAGKDHFPKILDWLGQNQANYAAKA